MAKATKLPSGSYRVQATVVIDGEKIKRSFTAPTAREAENEAYLWQTHCRMIGKDSSQMTFKEAGEDYLEKNKRLSASTVREYDRLLRNDFNDILNKKLCAINNVMLGRIKDRMEKTLVAATVKNRMGFAKRIFKVYYPDFLWNVTNPPIEKTKKREYSNDYITQILQAVKGTDFEIETYLGFLSLRRSEIGGLKWKDVNFEKGTIYISRAKVLNKENAQTVQERTKTDDSERIVYLPSYVLKILAERKSQSESEFVSTASINHYRERLQRLLKKANVEPCTFHELRHIYSTLTSSLGIDATIRMANGGWSSEKIMDGNYSHTLTDNQVYANNALNEYVNSVNLPKENAKTPKEQLSDYFQKHTTVTTKVTTQNKKRLKLARFVKV